MLYIMSGCTCIGVCACSAVAIMAFFFSSKMGSQKQCNNCNETEPKMIGDEMV